MEWSFALIAWPSDKFSFWLPNSAAWLRSCSQICWNKWPSIVVPSFMQYLHNKNIIMFTARHKIFIWARSFHTGSFMSSSSIMMPHSGLCLEYYSAFILELSCMHQLLCNHSCHIWADPCFCTIQLIAFEVGLFVHWGVIAVFLWKRESQMDWRSCSAAKMPSSVKPYLHAEDNRCVRLAVAGADLLWENSTAGWLADKPSEHSEYENYESTMRQAWSPM